MHRISLTPRPDWIAKVESVGFEYHTGGKPIVDGSYGSFWDESVAYRFTLAEVETIEDATRELHQLCLKAVDHVCANPALMDHFAIPAKFRDYVIRSWNRRDPTVMGRFDLVFDPSKPELSQPKMLEYNADTPTLVIETALVQWYWLQDVFPKLDQFNSLHERLITAYSNLGSMMSKGAVLHFSSIPRDQSIEEHNHVGYFADLALQAGLGVDFVSMGDIGWDGRRLVDLNNAPIQFWSKLYPWEWLAAEPFGEHLLNDQIGIVEPVWKMLLSNKALLPILWKLFPDHPNLLAASFDKPNGSGSYVAKPILSREGANIDIVRDGRAAQSTTGVYDSPKVYQAYADLRRADGNHVVIGSWIVEDQPAGMILRESDSPIVVANSKIVPHFIEG